jgi:mannose-1-phosphate guanylyltransferase
MLQHTLDRALGLSERDHIVTILGKGHRRYLEKTGDSPIPGVVIDQPFNMGTATGVFLAAVYIYSRDPDATMVLLPSDHFVYPEERFLSHLFRLYELAEQFEDTIILLGANPIRAETEYGWIEPREDFGQTDGASGNVDYSKVHSFHEKPDRDLALEFYRGGFLWNTMVVAVKVRTLLKIGWRLLPTMMDRFDDLFRTLWEIATGRKGAEYESLALSQVYEHLEEADFSRDILQAVARECIVHRMEGVDWSDWGKPQRIAESLDRIGRKGNFPAGLFEGYDLSRT